MRSAMVMGLAVMACGDPLVPQAYRGAAIAAFDLQIAAAGEPTPDTLQVAVFWASSLQSTADFDTWVEATGTQQAVGRPQQLTVGVFDAPTQHLLEYAPGRRAAFGSIFAYVDANRDGQRQTNEPVVGQLDERQLVYVPDPVTAEHSPTGRALAAGVHVVPLRLPCHRAGQVAAAPCAIPIGRACTTDDDCAGGLCLPEASVCVQPDDDLSCLAPNGVFVVDLPPSAERPSRYFLPACETACRDDECPQKCIDDAPRTVVRFRGHQRAPQACDDPTALAHGFFCVDSTQCEQRSGCFYREFGGSAYLACGFRADWADAHGFCQTFGGHLVTLDTPEEEAYLLDQGFDGWIGLNDQAEEGTFEWANGSSATYRNWNMPFSGNAIREEDCAVMKRHPRRIWLLDPCDHKKPFICEARFE